MESDHSEKTPQPTEAGRGGIRAFTGQEEIGTGCRAQRLIVHKSPGWVLGAAGTHWSVSAEARNGFFVGVEHVALVGGKLLHLQITRVVRRK